MLPFKPIFDETGTKNRMKNTLSGFCGLLAGGFSHVHFLATSPLLFLPGKTSPPLQANQPPFEPTFQPFTQFKNMQSYTQNQQTKRTCNPACISLKVQFLVVPPRSQKEIQTPGLALGRSRLSPHTHTRMPKTTWCRQKILGRTLFCPFRRHRQPFCCQATLPRAESLSGCVFFRPLESAREKLHASRRSPRSDLARSCLFAQAPNAKTKNKSLLSINLSVLRVTQALGDVLYHEMLATHPASRHLLSACGPCFLSEKLHAYVKDLLFCASQAP